MKPYSEEQFEKDVQKIIRKKEAGYGLTNSEIRALHDYQRVPHRPIFDKDRPYTPIVNQLQDRVHAVKTDSDLALASGSASTGKYPFQPTLSGTSATITYGTLNGVAPTNINGSFTVSLSGTVYLIITANASSGEVVSSSLSITSAAPSPPGTTYGFPPNTFSYILYVFNNGVPSRVIGLGSLQAIPVEAFRIPVSMGTPDMLPYQSYYTWRINGT